MSYKEVIASERMLGRIAVVFDVVYLALRRSL